jgi:hypothetical protein
MNYLLIRAYQKDDYLARLCVESWKASGFNGDIIFYSEHYEHKWIKDIGKTIWRDGSVSNFGGQAGARMLLDGFRQIDFKDDDYLITCDTDIVVFKNPMEILKKGIDMAGRGAMLEKAKYFHINNEIMPISGRMMRAMLNVSFDDFWVMVNEMINIGSSVSDGEYMSYFGYKNSYKLQEINNIDIWIHRKLYQYEGRTDWNEIINEVKLIQ